MDAINAAARHRHALSLEYANPDGMTGMLHRQRVMSALATVGKALETSKKPYIAFSGGKDSMVVLAMVQALRPGTMAVWSDDELEYPEVLEFFEYLVSRGGSDDLIITEGWAQHANWFDPWRTGPRWREPFPGTTRIDMPVDDWMAQQGYDLAFTGIRAEENTRREGWLNHAGPIYRVKSGVGTRCAPLHDWTADDVWAYTATQHLPVCGVYDVLEAMGVPQRSQRVVPLPLARRAHLQEGWPEMYERLVTVYGERWS